jgi:parallel beta-helix repeat protein
MRSVCQAGKDRDPAWYRIHRRWSIHLTALLLKANVNVNHVSFAMMGSALLAAVLFARPELAWNAAGLAAGYLSFMLDKVDGEIARYRKQQAPIGILLDRFHHRLFEPLVFLAVGWRAYQAGGSTTPLFAALAAMLAANIVEETQHLPAYIAAKHARETRAWPGARSRGPSPGLARAAAVMRSLKTFRMYLTVLPLVFAAMVAEALTGQPWTVRYLLLSAAALWVYVVFQAWYYANGKLDEDIASLERELPPLPGPDRTEAPHDERTAEAGPPAAARTPRKARGAGAATVAVLALGTLAATGAGAATYYVDATHPSASGSGPGTESQPYNTITAALMARAAPGNTILVKPGTYRETVTVPASGTAADPLVLRGHGGVPIVDGSEDFSSPARWVPSAGDVYLAASVVWSPKQVFVDGVRFQSSAKPVSSIPINSFKYVAGQGLYVNAGGVNPGVFQTRVGRRSFAFTMNGKSWVTVEGFEITRADDRAFNLTGGSSDIVLAANTITWSGKYGIYMSDCQRVRVASNQVSDNAHHGIMLTSGTSNCEIEDNESFRNAVPNSRAANGLYLYGSTNNVIRRNRWHHNQDTGQHFQAGSNDNVSINNLSYENGDHGFDHLGASGTLHLNDVAYGNYRDGFSIEGVSTGTRMFNCISMDNGIAAGNFDLWVEAASSPGFESNDNLFWNSNGAPPFKYGSTIHSTLASYAAASGQDTRSLQADPLFQDASMANFHLAPGSPAIDNGNSSEPAWPGADHEGNPRVDDLSTPNAGAGFVTWSDRGAFEYQPAGLPPAAVLAADPVVSLAPATVNLDASGSQDFDGWIASYYFDFGDGVSAGPQPGPVATHTYAAGTYVAVVTVTDDKGQTSTDTTLVVANRAPLAELSAGPLAGRAPLTVSLDASPSSDPDGSVATYRFDFSDGGTVGPQSGPTTTHVFGTGTWRVRLTVTDNHGQPDTLEVPVTVVVGAPNVLPVATLALTPAGGEAPLNVTADASGSSDPDGGIVSYRFTLDDTTVVGPQPGATASWVLDVGTHVVRVVVTDTDGATATALDTVVVTPPSPDLPPAIGAPAVVTVAEAGALTLGVTASDPDGDAIASLTADLSQLPPGNDAVFTPAPDFRSGTLVWHPTHTDSGTYAVTFTAGNALVGTFVTTIEVRDANRAPVASAPDTAAAAEGSPLSVFVLAGDEDGDPITSLTADLSGLPPGHGAVFTPGPGNTSGTLAWTPGFTHSGTYAVRFMAGNAQADTATTWIVVADVDRAPVVVSPAGASVLAGEPVTVLVTATDPDGDGIASLTADLSGLPAGHTATFTPAPGNGSGTFAWTPAAGDSGSFDLVFTGANAASGQSVTRLVVGLANQPPVAVLVATPATGNAPLDVILDATGSSDPEGPVASYRFDFGDGTVVGPQATGFASHTYAAGVWLARVTVTDADGAVNTVGLAITVAAPGPGPNLVANSSFESATSGWNGYSSAAIARVSGGFDGGWALQMTSTTGTLSSFGANDSPNWVTNAGAAGSRYRFGAWVRSAGSLGSARLQVREYLGATKVGPTTLSVPVPLSTGWQYITVDHVSQASGSSLDFQVYDSPIVTGEVFLVDNVSIHLVPPAGPALVAGDPNAAASPAGPPGMTDGAGVPLQFGARMVPSVARAEATLHLGLTLRGRVRVDLFDASGRLVRNLLDHPDMAPGLHLLHVDGRGDRGDRLGSGVYFYRVQAADRSAVGRYVLVR